MFREEYRREMEAISPDEAQMARLLAAMEEERPVKKQVFRTVLLAAALGAALITTTLAVSPTLRELLSAAMGSFEPYSQAVEGVSVVDQGIQVTLSSILADENGGAAIFEITDLTGDRLDETTQITVHHAPRLKQVGWDEETGTLLVKATLSSEYGFEWDEDRKLTVAFTQFQPGWVELEDIDLPWDLLTGQVLKSQSVTAGKDDGYTSLTSHAQQPDENGNYGWSRQYSSLKEGVYQVLVPGQTPAALGNDYMALSSMGFDQEGQLHVQFELLGDARPYNRYAVSYWRSTRIEGALTGQETQVIFDGGKYVDVCFHDIGPELLGQFQADQWDATLCTTAAIEGNWTLEFKVPLMEVRQVTSPAGNEFCDIVVDQLAFSVSGFRFDYRYPGERRSVNPCWQPTIYLSSGTTVQPNTVRAEGRRLFQRADGTIIDQDIWASGHDRDAIRYGGELYFPYEEAIDPKDVVGVAIGAWYIPIEGEQAGAGYWLTQAP